MKHPSVKGYRFAGVSAGIKKTKKKDVALIVSDVPAVVAGSFTSGRVKAAPVVVSMENIRSGVSRAVVVNSGNANACTGARGLKDANDMVNLTARLLSVKPAEVLVCSTGKIGVPMPMAKVASGIAQAAKSLSPENMESAAEAILTTDHSMKVSSVKGKIGGKSYAIVGFAKGAGMIEPHMKMAGKHATMLAYLLTDALVDKKTLETIFERCIERSFNCVTVDGDMSTNDTAFVLANGLAGNKRFSPDSKEGRDFSQKLLFVMEDLAKQMVKDGEGATKCVRIEVKGAKSREDAKKMAYTIANSLLVKTAFFGQDPNWGRIMGAAGRAQVPFDPEKADIHYDKVCVARRGVSTGEAADRKAKAVMKSPEFTMTLDAHLGKGEFYLYASDLTLDYVKINSCYRP